MYATRLLLFVALALHAVNAAPLVKRGYGDSDSESEDEHSHPHRSSVTPGSVLRARPADFYPLHGGNHAEGGSVAHPVIAVGHPGPHDYFPAVSASHTHPDHMQDHEVHGADHYTQNTHKQFQPGTTLAVGHPVGVHLGDAQHVPYHDRIPNQLHPYDAHNLVNAVHASHNQASNYNQHLNHDQFKHAASDAADLARAAHHNPGFHPGQYGPGPQHSHPGFPPQHGHPGFPPQHSHPGFPQQGHPGFSQHGHPGFPPQHGHPQQPQHGPPGHVIGSSAYIHNAAHPAPHHAHMPYGWHPGAWNNGGN